MTALDHEGAKAKEIGRSSRKPRTKKRTTVVHPNSMAARKWGRKTFTKYS